MKPKILTFTGYYLPGVKGGGPIRTIASMVEILGDEFDFKIVTADRDFGSCDSYPEVQPSIWQLVDKARVLYLSPKELNWLTLRRVINTSPHDILYINSFFSPYFSIIPLFLRRLAIVSKKPTIVAPRGEFSLGALNLKSLKKKLFIGFSKVAHLHEQILWQVSSEYEREDVLRIFKLGNFDSALRVMIAPDLSNINKFVDKSTKFQKNSETLKLVFLSRISPKKNLEGALKMLQGVKGKIVFNIYGPIEDSVYWEKCLKIIEQLPNNISVQYLGIVAHTGVCRLLAEHDLFFLPTSGENFGHVIAEALVAGCPILISDQTPWRNLEKMGVGWDLPLDQEERFTRVLQRCVDMDHLEWSAYSKRAEAYGVKKISDPVAVQQNRDLFLKALQMT